MPPLLAVSTLEGAACSSLSRLLVQAFAKLEAKKEESYEGSEEEKGVEEALDCLPAALLERATHQALVLLTSQAGVRGTGPGWQFSRVRGGTAATFPGLPTALRLLPRPATTSLDIGALFSGARLSRSLSVLCRQELATGLVRATRLTRLHLRSKCSDALLATVASSCPLLQEINISLSEQVTDAGLEHLHACSSLASVDLLKCWAITPAGVAGLLLALPRLRKLYFANMKAVMEELSMVKDMSKGKKELSNVKEISIDKEEISKEEAEEKGLNVCGPFLLEHFDSSEYSLAVPGEGTRPEVESSWMDGLTSFANISVTFPWISTCRLMASDQEVAHLNFLPHLRHLEVEFSDDPGTGLLSLLNKHPNRAHFIHIFLQVGPLLASHLQALAKNCPMLQHFRLIGFKVEDAASLKDIKEDFQHLRQLNISLYDCEEDSSDEEEEQEDAGVVGRVSVEVASFFLQSALQIEVVNLHMNFGCHLNFCYLTCLLDRNPLLHTSHFHISSPKTVQLGEEAVRLVVSRMPALTSLKVSSWDIDYHWFMKEMKEEAKRENMDITYL